MEEDKKEKFVIKAKDGIAIVSKSNGVVTVVSKRKPMNLKLFGIMFLVVGIVIAVVITMMSGNSNRDLTYNGYNERTDTITPVSSPETSPEWSKNTAPSQAQQAPSEIVFSGNRSFEPQFYVLVTWMLPMFVLISGIIIILKIIGRDL